MSAACAERSRSKADIYVFLKFGGFEFSVEFATDEYPDDCFFAFEEFGFAFKHLRPDIPAADFADGICFDTCRHRDVIADGSCVWTALPYVAVADDDNRSFLCAAELVAVGS